MNTMDNLIASLSAEVKSEEPLKKPFYWCVRMLAVCALYAAAQLCLGLRPDLAVQFSRPFFVAEIILLTLLLLTSLLAAVLSMYPDAYQKPKLLKLPYAAFAGVFGLVAFQLLMPHDTRMVIPQSGAHAIECALCISAVALIPSALIFGILCKGASVRPLQGGAFAVLAASAIGAITLRLAEENDSIEHLVQWHYAPTLIFASLGALLGKFLLKW